MDKPITTAILESCPTKIFLPNPDAQSAISSLAYRQIGLTERQIEILSYARPKRQYYYTSPLGQRLFDLGLGPVALSFVGASGKEDLAEVKMLIRTFGDDWPAEWLWQRGLHVAAGHWLGGASECKAAMDTMHGFRDTWPAEWLRRHGQTALADQWLGMRAVPNVEPDEQYAFAAESKALR